MAQTSQPECVKRAAEAAELFLRRVSEYRGHDGDARCSERSALKRASMELTKALAEMRQRGAV